MQGAVLPVTCLIDSLLAQVWYTVSVRQAPIRSETHFGE